MSAPVVLRDATHGVEVDTAAPEQSSDDARSASALRATTPSGHEKPPRPVGPSPVRRGSTSQRGELDGRRGQSVDSAAAAGSGLASSGGGGGSGNERDAGTGRGVGRHTAAYEETLAAWLNAHKYYPTTLRRRGIEGEGKLRIRIARSGRLLGVDVATAFPHPSLAAVSQDWVNRAQPFPPVPDGVPGNEYVFIVPVGFRLR